MNIKLLLILFAAIGGLSYGVLSNEMTLSVQKFDFLALPAMDEDPSADHDALGSFTCSCFGTDPVTGEERFDPGFCNVEYEVEPTEDDPGIPAEGSLGLSGNKLCLWEVHSNAYGELLLDSEQGCSANFWLEHSDMKSKDYVWAPGYQPDYEYSSIFLVGFDDIVDEIEIMKFYAEYEKYQEGLDELQDSKKIDKKTLTAIKRLQTTILSPEQEGYKEISEEKLENLNNQLMGILEKNELSEEDLEFLLETEINLKKGELKDDKFTLLQALSNNSLKQKQKQIAMQSVTALLNAAHPEVNYHYSVPEVMSITYDAIMSEDYMPYANELKKYNDAGGSSLCS